MMNRPCLLSFGPLAVAVVLSMVSAVGTAYGQNAPPPGDHPKAAAQDKLPTERLKKIGDTWVNSIGMKFTYIPAGEFDMGSPETEAGRDKNETLHHVKITKPFLMATTTVTQAQWKAVMGDHQSENEGADLPVDLVSWNDAVAFCEKLGAKEGKHYHLPTEAEWEYACRAGTTTPFNTGETISTDQANYAGTSVYGKGVKGLDREQTTPAGKFKPNAWGLYDMHGNLWQWCSDGYGSYAGDAVDPQGASDKSLRVLRGGSWGRDAAHCRSACRNARAPDLRYIYFGFRLCLDL